MIKLNTRPIGDQEVVDDVHGDILPVVGSTPLGWQHSFTEFDHKIFFMINLSLLLIQEGQLSVSGERMCTILVSCLED